MNGKRSGIPDVENVIEYVFEGKDGELLRTSLTEVTTSRNGVVRTVKTSRQHELEDHFLWHPGLGVALLVCASCRVSPGGKDSHGLCLAQNAVYCIRCSIALCPTHRVWCADEQWRCDRCARRFRRRQFWRRLFFTPVEED